MKLHFENLQEEVFITDLHEEISEIDTTIEHCSSKPKTFPPEMIYIENIDQKKNKKKTRNYKVQDTTNPTLKKHEFLVSNDKWKRTIAKRKK